MGRFKLVLFLLSVLALANMALGGDRILIYIPYAGKSSCITLLPIARELVNRGHHVTLVSEFDTLKVDNRVQHIVIPSKNADESGIKLTGEFLKERDSKQPAVASVSFDHVHQTIQRTVDSNTKAFARLKPLVESKQDINQLDQWYLK